MFVSEKIWVQKNLSTKKLRFKTKLGSQNFDSRPSKNLVKKVWSNWVRGAIKKNRKIWEKFPIRLDPPPLGNFRLF